MEAELKEDNGRILEAPVNPGSLAYSHFPAPFCMWSLWPPWRWTSSPYYGCVFRFMNVLHSHAPCSLLNPWGLKWTFQNYTYDRKDRCSICFYLYNLLHMHHTLKTRKYFWRLVILYKPYSIDTNIFILETRWLEHHRTGQLKSVWCWKQKQKQPHRFRMKRIWHQIWVLLYEKELCDWAAHSNSLSHSLVFSQMENKNSIFASSTLLCCFFPLQVGQQERRVLHLFRQRGRC